MMRPTSLLALGLLLLVAGCSSGGSSSGSATPEAKSSLPEAGKEPAPAEPEAAPSTKEAPPTKEPEPKGNPLPGAPRPPILVDNIPRANSEGWTLVETSPLQVAKRVDQQIRSMRTVRGGFRFAFDVRQGRASGEGTLFVKDQNTWRMQLPKFINEEPGVTYDVAVADGKRFARIADKGWTAPVPVANRRDFRTGELARRWPLEMMSLAFAGIGNNSSPWTNYLAEVTKDKSLQARVDQRVIDVNGQPQQQLRILVDRTPAEAKTKGLLIVELVLEKNFMIPVSMRSAVHSPDPKQKPQLVNWSAEWMAQRDFAGIEFKTPDRAMPAQVVK